MKRKSALLALVAAGPALALACITVNIYFPEATVKKTADEIVDEIRKKEAKDKTAAEVITDEETPASLDGSAAAGPWALDQQETDVSNPAIRALKEAMKVRFALLKPVFDSGRIGESNAGLVDVRSEEGLGLKDKAALRGLVKEENADRMSLYAEVAKALKIESSQIGRIQRIFAGSWINAASPGWWIQKDNGEWTNK